MQICGGKVRDKFFIGFEVGTGKEIYVPPAHMVITGITRAGKTTCIESVVHDSGMTAVLFKTKVGEKAITTGHKIPPFFREKHDWVYVQSLLEATLKEKLKFERAWIIEVCKRTHSLGDVKVNIDAKLEDKKVRGISRNVYLTLQAYFDMILPQLRGTEFTNELTLSEGINIMDLEDFSGEIQSLVIRSVLEEVLYSRTATLVVAPEFWKFCPQHRGNPVKPMAEEFIRQSATNDNFLVIDSIPNYEAVFVRLNERLQVTTMEALFNELKGNVRRATPSNEEIMDVTDYNLEVLGPSGSNRRMKWVSVKKIIRHPYDGELLSLSTLDGVIDVSPNHPLMKYPHHLTEAENIQVGDRLCSWKTEGTRVTGYGGKGNANGFFVGTEGLAWLMGFFAAEGWTNGKHVCLANKDKKLLEKAKEEIYNTFHLSASYTTPRRGVYTLDVASPNLVNFFKQCYWSQEEHTCYTKIVPESILNAPISIKQAYLDGYVEGDGHITAQGELSLCSASRPLLGGLTILARATGKFDTWRLYIRKDKEKVVQLTGTRYNRKKRDKVKKILRKKYSGYLYDFEVDSHDHTFYLGIGNIRVHNSQDMAGIDKTILKQVSTWVLGNQREINEVKHTLAQIPLPTKAKPKPEDIQTLKTGHFYVCTSDFTTKVYVKPTWMDAKTAKGVALGDNLPIPEAAIHLTKKRGNLSGLNLSGLTIGKNNDMSGELTNNNPPQSPNTSPNTPVNMDLIVDAVLLKIGPKLQAIKEEILHQEDSYVVAPLEKIKKDFLQETKEWILRDVSSTTENQRKILRFFESSGKGSNITQILDRVFGMSTTSKGNRERVLDNCKTLKFLNLIRMDSNNRMYPYLRDRISDRLLFFDATEEEINLIYDHILTTIINEDG